ncbi:porin family protein [uncultured Flavobacterium sp.]|uniref:porin family protein n=1 Tax=uncultured Flavobacterium sp. TaxID=165435 RepID=UPI0025FFF376|nr:porin family protein [uncultured Flavobacterium sp.]
MTAKKLLALVGWLYCVASFGQAKGDLELGIGIGTSRSSVNYQDSRLNPQTANSINFGGSADYNFANRWSVKAKIVYDTKGWNDGTLFFRGGQLFNADVDLHYLTVPIMLSWHFGGQRNWYINFGSYAGFLVAAGEENFDADIKEAFKDTDIGLTLGIGAKIPVSRFLKIYIEYDFQTGFGNLYKDNIVSVSKAYSTRNAFNVGVNFLVL